MVKGFVEELMESAGLLTKLFLNPCLELNLDRGYQMRVTFPNEGAGERKALISGRICGVECLCFVSDGALEIHLSVSNRTVGNCELLYIVGYSDSFGNPQWSALVKVFDDGGQPSKFLEGEFRFVE